MLPLRQTVPPSTVPKVTRSLVAGNAVLFAALLMMGSLTERIIVTFGYIPARLMNPEAYNYMGWEVGVTLFTSLFLHGGFVHLLGNLIFLWVFGPAIEDAMGHPRYFFFFLACGAAGSLAHTALFPSSPIPSIGASGSIAGLLGAFLMLRPMARIVTLLPLVVYWAMIEVPAVLFMPVWFATQFFNGYASLNAARATQEVAGIAWWAHVGGFLFGAAVGLIMRLSTPPPEPVRR